MLFHVVMIKFKSGVNDDDINAVESALDDLPNKIVEINTYEFGRDIVKSERSYDFSLIATFANVTSMERYQKHPDHVAVLKTIRAISEDIRAVDFEV